MDYDLFFIGDIGDIGDIADGNIINMERLHAQHNNAQESCPARRAPTGTDTSYRGNVASSLP